jgi:predicted transcriptional regulator
MSGRVYRVIPSDVKKFIRYRSLGWSIRRIAAECGWSYKTINKHIKQDKSDAAKATVR